MSEENIMKEIQRILGDLALSKGLSEPVIAADTLLLGGGLSIDSLDLALLVRELEELAGHDPFRAGFINFRTAGELAALYKK